MKLEQILYVAWKRYNSIPKSFFLQITKNRQLEQYVFGMQFVKMGGERSIVTVKDR